MKIITAWVLAIVFTSLALLHAYWAGGGKGAGMALPKQPNGKLVFQPGRAACLVVALGLGGFASICLAHAGVISPLFLAGRTKVVLLVMGGIFGLRTIGDFKFVGLFRRVHPTDFSRMDRAFYTPLCAALCGSLVWLAWSE